MEITGNPYGQIIQETKNPGKLSAKIAGSGRGIAENLFRLGNEVEFISAAGNDFAGRSAKRELEEIGVDTSNVMLIDGENTAASFEIYNIMDGLEMAFGNDDVLEKIDEDILKGAMDKLKESDMIIMDAGIDTEAMDYIAKALPDTPLFLDPGSLKNAEKMKEHIGKFQIIAPDREEAERLCGRTILSAEQLMEAGQWFSEQGVEKVFIKIAAGGAYYAEGGRSGIIKPDDVKVVESHGAGDAFSAAAADGIARGMDIEEAAAYAMAAAAMTVEVSDMTCRELSAEAVKRRMK